MNTAQAYTGTPWEAFENGMTFWEDFSPAEQEAVVKHYAPKIRFLALRLKAKLPRSVELNEMISSGTLGLMEALGKFRPQMGIRFETYAENRIRGAMLDELRRLDWFPRSLRQRVRVIDELIHRFEHEKGRVPTEAEIQQETGMELRDVRQAMGQAPRHAGGALGKNGPISRKFRAAQELSHAPRAARTWALAVCAMPFCVSPLSRLRNCTR